MLRNRSVYGRGKMKNIQEKLSSFFDGFRVDTFCFVKCGGWFVMALTSFADGKYIIACISLVLSIVFPVLGILWAEKNLYVVRRK